MIHIVENFFKKKLIAMSNFYDFTEVVNILFMAKPRNAKKSLYIIQNTIMSIDFMDPFSKGLIILSPRI
jgi:hypothetical protein